MAYRFKLSEPFDEGVRRIGVQQIDRAIAQLRAAARAGSAIHETRKGLKRVRALLRIARPGLSEGSYDSENARLRDTGRLLSEARDKQVLIETVGKFEDLASGRTKTAFATARTRLLSADRAGPSSQHSGAIGEALGQLGVARENIGGLKIDGDGYEVAFEGMERAYRQGGRAFEEAYDKLDNEAIHEWRKRVQHHWRHMALLAEAWPEVMGARVATAKQLSMLLGEDHDIAVMLAALQGGGGERGLPAGKAGRSKSVLSTHQHKLTAEAALERQAKLRCEACNLGRRLFAEPAAAFRARLAVYWASAEASAPRL